MTVPPPPIRAIVALCAAGSLLTIAEFLYAIPRPVATTLNMALAWVGAYLIGLMNERNRRYKDAMRHQEEIAQLQRVLGHAISLTPWSKP